MLVVTDHGLSLGRSDLGVTPELSTRKLCYSARLVRPFVRLLSSYPSIADEWLVGLDELDPDARVPAALVHELLRGAIELTGDRDLGLKAARELAPGDLGAIEYLARSAATWREAYTCVSRSIRLLNDNLELALSTDEDRALVRLESSHLLPRSVADFQSAALFVIARVLSPDDTTLTPTVYFVHQAPSDLGEYTRTFGRATLRFDAPWNGFSVPLDWLDRSLPTSDTKLHVLIQQHADALLAELPQVRTMTQSVRELITMGLAGGPPTAASVAQSLTISQRTLLRRLDQENTKFKLLVEDVRHRLALRYVAFTELTLSEIAYLLGFSQSAAFHRAFRRWTHQTPSEYRRGYRDAQALTGPRA